VYIVCVCVSVCKGLEYTLCVCVCVSVCKGLEYTLCVCVSE
jgi:hypothetical protein